MERGWISLLALVALVLCGPAAQAATIAAWATDLSDLLPGQDRWQFEYTVTGDFPEGFGFDVLFPVADGFRAGDLLSGTGPSADWDVLLLQPSETLPDDGRFDSLALQGNPATPGAFIVQFVWRGVGTPGAQPFEVFDDGLVVVDAGQTSPVPLPAPLLPLVIALAALARSCRKQQGRLARPADPTNS